MINYSYFIIDNVSCQAAVVDPSWEIDKFHHLIEEMDLTLSKILLTHSHFDHTNLVYPLVEKYNAEVYISSVEAEYYNYNSRNLRYMEDGSVISIGESDITCLLTPGHTKGSVCYFHSGSLFTGDTVFIEGCGICSYEGGSAEEMFHSIQNIKKKFPNDVKIYPGHSYGRLPGQTLHYLMKNNIYFNINDKDVFVAFRTRKNQRNLFSFR